MTIAERNARVQLLIEQLRKTPEKFDYEFVFGEEVEKGPEKVLWREEARDSEVSAQEFVRNCNSTACFAGWTIALFAPEEPLDTLYYWTPFDNQYNRAQWMKKATELLGLTAYEGEKLFCGGGSRCANTEEAIDFLQQFIDDVNQKQAAREELEG